MQTCEAHAPHGGAQLKADTLRKPELSVVGLAEEVAEDLTTSRDSAIGVDVVPQSILLGLPLACVE